MAAVRLPKAYIFIEVNEHVMKPLEEYMFFTKTGAEKVNVTNSYGVRSAQCSPYFDRTHKIPAGPTNLNISQGKDKTWVEDAPQRVLYKSIYSATSIQEESTEQIIVITLSVFFVLVLMGCVYELYRTDKQYRRRKEMETDASIIWSKEQAAKMQEPVNVPLKQTKDYDGQPTKLTQNGKIPTKSANGTTANGNGILHTPVIDITPDSPVIESPAKNDRSEKRISFKDNASELEWNHPDEKTNLLLSTMPEEDEEVEEDDINEDEALNESEIDGLYKSIHSIPEESEEEADDERPYIIGPMSPMFLDVGHRRYGNPVSYLGGPVLSAKARSSLESVLSLD